ncbi:MAG: transglycosylase domain-containing protein, partial [Prevotellaceae bacterium]|nr:transglycosylase domain-containing protein [Prevotellaceae bacterium]
MRKIKQYRAFILYLAVVVFFCLPNYSADDPYCTVIEDADGELLGARIASDGQWRFPAKETFPDKYAKALVAFEDRRFYSHRGIDPIAVCRALIRNIRQGRTVEGGSTISMQAVR